MFNKSQSAGNNPARGKRRHKLAISASVVGAAAASLAMAVSAGASPTPPANVNYTGATATGAATANNLIVGSGSSTDYQMMIGLDTLFNQTPGCVITSGSVTGAPSKGSQELNYACETNSGGTTLEQTPGSSYLDNPINDVAVEEPPMGSSNGIAQLELGRNQAKTGIGTSFNGTTTFQNVSAINYARSSRDPSSANDVAGLNFVAYAKDGVAPLIFTEFNGAKTEFGKTIVTSGLTTLQLEQIYNGTIYDWGQLGAKASAPIFVYSAQEGSGTQSTFKTFLGNNDPSASTNGVNCKDPVAIGTKVSAGTAESDGVTTEVGSGKTATPWPATPTTGCKGPDVIFENEDASILANASSTTEDPTATAWAAENSGGSPVGDSIFFYSYGKYNLQCEGLKEQVSYIDKSTGPKINLKAGTDCGSEAVPSTLGKTTLALTPVNGVAPSAASILATTGTDVYPIDRYLYNVYSNGSNANLPEATAATLNYVSEVGFICKPQTIDGTATDTAANEIIDPATGVWYHTEIFNTIVDNGFIPVTAADSGGFGALTDGPPISENAAAGATHTAYSLLSAGTPAYGATYLNTDAPGQTSNTSIDTGTDPTGYCILSDTDGNTNS